jgi:uncharacterized protein (TIGR03435 family)
MMVARTDQARMVVRLAACLTAVMMASAQGPEVRFEVASVKASPPLPPGGARVIAGSPQPGGRWLSQNAPLMDILRAVYPEYRLRGQIAAPDWVTRTRFDIDARAGRPDAARADLIGMMKHLLAERFALEVRVEMRELEVQALTVARDDGRPGRGLRPSSVDCEAGAVAAEQAKGGAPGGQRDGQAAGPLCMALAEERPNGLVRVRGRAAAISHLISMIQGGVRDAIVDRTGLTGRYDLELEFNPELGSLRPSENAPGSSLATALVEQLGLRLQPQRAPMTVLVIERVEMPTPD